MKAARHHREAARSEKKSWTHEETDALLKGVERWGKVKDDPDFGPVLIDRTTVDIKDKYRNLMTRRKSTTSKEKEQVRNGQEVIIPPANTVLDKEVSLSLPKSGRKENTRKKRMKKEPEIAEEQLRQVPAFEANREPQSTLVSMNDSMTLTVSNGKKNLILSVKGTLKGSTLLSFAIREFSLTGSYTLLSDEMRKPLDTNKTLRDQVPMFDLLRVVKIEEAPICEH